jgi:hypothetical protein
VLGLEGGGLQGVGALHLTGVLLQLLRPGQPSLSPAKAFFLKKYFRDNGRSQLRRCIEKLQEIILIFFKKNKFHELKC